MSHFAFVDSSGVVRQVIVADQNFIDTKAPTPAGYTWVETSYGTRAGHASQGNALRKNFAGIGYKYDKSIDAFVPPKTYPSWRLNNETAQWEAPVKRPEGDYVWNEQSLKWVKPTR